MKIIVDADACPVIGIVEAEARQNKIPVTLVCDTAHLFHSDYSQVVTVEKGADSADFKIVTMAGKGDIVVTQDYGVASMCLGKGVFPIHQSGKWYTAENIDQMMFERHIAQRGRGERPGKIISKGLTKSGRRRMMTASVSPSNG